MRERILKYFRASPAEYSIVFKHKHYFDLKTKLPELNNGAQSLSEGLGTLSSSSKDLSNGAKTVNDGASSLSSGLGTLSSSSKPGIFSLFS